MTFEWPTLLLSLLLIPILAILYLLAQRRRRAYAVRFTNLALLQEVAPKRPGVRRHLPPLLFLLGLAALFVSLARPQAVIAVPRDGAAVILVMDVSGSMAATDLRPDRLSAARQAALSFVDALPTNAQIGVVSFSSTASVAAPLSRDPDVARNAIRGLVPNGGTAIGDGLDLALDQLASRPMDERGERAPALVVLLSDGQQTDGRMPPEVAATRAYQEGVTVHTVGIGQRGVSIPLGRSRQIVGLDERTLERVAEATQGQYFYAAEAEQLERIYEDLGSRITWVQERTEVTALASAVGAVLLTLSSLLGLRWFQQFP